MPRYVNLANVQQFTAINITSDPGAAGGSPLVPSCAQIVLQWTTETGIVGHNVLHGRFAGGYAGTVAQANGIKTALTTGAAWTALAAHLAPSCTLSFVTIRNVDVADQALIPSNVGGGVGTSSGTALPLEVAAVLTKRTALVGRANRGRIYVPGWATTALGTGNVIAAAALTALNNWGATINGALSANGYTHVLGHVARVAYTGSTGTQHPARPAGSVDVTSVSAADNHWDSQRRRGLR
jgi:hypothetical protein